MEKPEKILAKEILVDMFENGEPFYNESDIVRAMGKYAEQYHQAKLKSMVSSSGVSICAYIAYIGDEEKVVLAENIADAMDKLEEVTDSTTDISVRPVSFDVIS